MDKRKGVLLGTFSTTNDTNRTNEGEGIFEGSTKHEVRGARQPTSVVLKLAVLGRSPWEGEAPAEPDICFQFSVFSFQFSVFSFQFSVFSWLGAG